MATSKKLDAEHILRRLAEMRKSIPYLDQVPPRPSEDRRDAAMADFGRTEEDFEHAAVVEALQSLADDVSAAVAGARARALESALKVYYAAEELARDPANAHLIPHVEQMREAYQKEYGRPIPPKPKE